MFLLRLPLCFGGKRNSVFSYPHAKGGASKHLFLNKQILINHYARPWSENVKTPPSSDIYSYSRPLPLSFFLTAQDQACALKTPAHSCVLWFCPERAAPRLLIFILNF